jgi:hypothetical protein
MCDSKEEPMFFVVQAFRHGLDEFRVEGVFTLESDAANLVSVLERNPHVIVVAPLQRVPFYVVENLFVQSKLGTVFAKSMAAIERLLEKNGV